MAELTSASKSFVEPLQLYQSASNAFKESLYQIPFKERRDLLESLSEEFTSVDSFVEWCSQNYPDSTNCPQDNPKAPARRSKKTK